MDGAGAAAAIGSLLRDIKVLLFTTYAMAPPSLQPSTRLSSDSPSSKMRRMQRCSWRPGERRVRERRARPGLRSLSDGLTERETEVLTLIARGRSKSEIAAELYVAEAIVKTNVNQILAKTASRDRIRAATYARDRGLAD